MHVHRRTAIKGAVGGALAAGPFAGFANAQAFADHRRPRRGRRRHARPGRGRPRQRRTSRTCRAGFAYRSFHDTSHPGRPCATAPGCPDGTTGWARSPGRTARSCSCATTRSTTRCRPSARPSPTTSAAGAGTTTIRVTKYGEVQDAYTSLSGTMMNCSGGQMPWGAWVTCEETVNGPDVGPDFTGASNVPLQKRHGYVFEVPAGGLAGRPHRSARPDASPTRRCRTTRAEGILYLTEDNFAFPSGFYRYVPRERRDQHRNLDHNGQLQMLAVVGRPQRTPRGPPGHARPCTTWSGWTSTSRTSSSPTHPARRRRRATTRAINFVGNQGRAQGAAHFSRLRGPGVPRRRRLLHRHAGRRAGDDRTRTTSAATAAASARSGATTPARRPCAASTSPRAATCSTSRTTSPPARAAPSCCARTTT